VQSVLGPLRMEGRVTANVRLAPVVAALLVVLAGECLNPADAREEANCLAAPGAPAPAGHHWFYRLDRPKQRKCWYLRAQAAAEAAAKATPREAGVKATPREAGVKATPKPRVHIASAVPEAKSPAPSGPLVAAIRLEPFADEPASAAPDDRAAQLSARDDVGASRETNADFVTEPSTPAPTLSDAAATPSLASSDSRIGSAAQNGGEERIREARSITAAAAKADADTYDAADVGTEPRDLSRMEASARMGPLAFLGAGIVLLIAGMFLHRIVQIFARQPVPHTGRAAPALMTSVSGEWKMPEFLTPWRNARLNRRDYHLDEI
jgi:hypothetical protein